MSRITKIIYLNKSEVPVDPPVDPPPDPRDTTAPPTPGNVQATSGLANKIDLTCDSVTDPEGPPGSLRSGMRDYGWYVATSSAGTYTLLRRTTVPNTSHTGLANGVTRYYRVTARDNAGNESPQSAPVSATTAISVGNQPPVWQTAEVQIVASAAGVPTTLRLKATDSEGDPVTYSATTLPAGWTLTDLTNQTLGALLTIPADEPAGVYTVEAVASDSTLPTVEGIVNLQVVSSSGGEIPWTFGHPFKKGDFPSSKYISSNATKFQAEIRNRWEDGSAKYAVLSGVSSSGTINIRTSDTAPAAAANVAEPTAAYLAANVVVTLTGDGAGTYTPGPAREAGAIPWDRSLPSKRREILGPVMSEFHYYSPTSDPHVTIWWHVRAYVDGSVEVETVFENGWMYVANPTHKKYGVTITIGGTERYSTPMIGMPFWYAAVRSNDKEISFPGKSIADFFRPANTVRFAENFDTPYLIVSRTASVVTFDGLNVLPASVAGVQIDGHPHHTRWSRCDWVGADPGVSCKHDGAYFIATHFTPPFYTGDGLPSNSTLNNLKAPAAPFEAGGYPGKLGDAGTNAEPIVHWSAHYVKSNGDIRAYNSMIAHARSAGRYGIHYRDENTGLPPVFASHPNGTYASIDAGIPGIGITSSAVKMPFGGTMPPHYSATHAWQLAFIPYVATGRQSFRDEVEFQAQVTYFRCNKAASFFEGQRVPVAAVTAFTSRGAAWSLRPIMEAVACLPDDEPRRAQYVTQLGATYGYYDANYTGQNALGVIQPNTGYADGKPVCSPATFQEHFFTSAMLLAYDLVGHALSAADQTRAESFLDFKCKHIVGLFGDSTGYCYRDAAYYTPAVAEPNLSNSDKFTAAEFNAGVYPDWATAYTKTAFFDTNGNWVGPPVGDTCEASTALRGLSGALPGQMLRDEGSYWAIALGPLALAVDYGADGALDSWGRFTGASNFSLTASDPYGFRNIPNWGFWPRSL